MYGTFDDVRTCVLRDTRADKQVGEIDVERIAYAALVVCNSLQARVGLGMRDTDEKGECPPPVKG